MTKFNPLLFALLFITVPAIAAPNAINEVLERQRQHGFISPSLAVEALTAVRGDLAGAPVELRMRYHNQLALLYIGAENAALVKVELDELERMATDEKCVPCGQYKTVRQAQQAIRGQDTAASQALVGKLEAIASADANLMQAVHYVRAGHYDTVGLHARAIEEALVASQLAMSTANPAEQVRTLNVLMLANIGRRDLVRAESLSKEAFALAERIGYVYMMAYIRANGAWIHSLKGEHAKQLQALNDVLKITREHPGLGDSELVALVNLAEYHYEQKSYKQAVQLATQAIALADQQGKPVAKGVVMISLGQSQIELGESDKGVQSLQTALVLLNKAGAKSYVMDATRGLADGYERAGRHKDALATLHAYVKLKDEATLREREKAIAEAQEKFSGERKDNEILRLSLESRGRQAEVDARVWQQRLWATAALALALGGALLMLMIKRSRARNRVLEDSNAVLSDQSVHDPLTGAFNRRHCVTLMSQHEALLASKSRDRNYSAGVGLMLLDVDHFKHINDTFGHAAGDAVLVEIAQRLLGLVRQHDVVVRWGGEEFVLVLPGTSAEGMAVLAERVLQVIGSAPVVAEGKSIPVTVSAGGVSYPLLPGQPWQDALKVADVAMYMAKESGRNLAICLITIASDTAMTTLVDDLAGAVAAGKVLAKVIAGPVAQVDHGMQVSI
ncbi:diguanylate cyclase [Massilia sp. TWP1-3-3]|uniref:GGDEF domain-containing protein n=1 Tax=Massilia sp. TWP1-3-3 TaxID=2804573 RepID=UPI003CEFDC19